MTNDTMTPAALIFDLNGTMIDDMAYHGEVWFDILNKLGAGLDKAQVKKQLYGKNEELLERVFGKGHFSEAQLQEISMEKERTYQEIFLPHLALIAGLPELLEKAARLNIPMAIGSAAIRFNIDFVLDNLNIRHYFKAIVSADDVANGKPDPETFLKCAALLGVTQGGCIVFEDAPKGVETARNAGMKAVVITTAHPAEDFAQYDNALMFISDYTDERLSRLF
jgi:beta-phosphoglucomutase family hydrolase